MTTKPIIIIATLVFATLSACAVDRSRQEIEPKNGDSTVGNILHPYAIQRSVQECQVKGLTDDACKKSIDDGQKHLDGVYARINVFLKNPKTNLCDLVRFVRACADTNYTLADWADCMQVLPDRVELQNSGQFVFKLDAQGCPVGAAIKAESGQ